MCALDINAVRADASGPWTGELRKQLEANEAGKRRLLFCDLQLSDISQATLERSAAFLLLLNAGLIAQKPTPVTKCIRVSPDSGADGTSKGAASWDESEVLAVGAYLRSLFWGGFGALENVQTWARLLDVDPSPSPTIARVAQVDSFLKATASLGNFESKLQHAEVALTVSGGAGAESFGDFSAPVSDALSLELKLGDETTAFRFSQFVTVGRFMVSSSASGDSVKVAGRIDATNLTNEVLEVMAALTSFDFLRPHVLATRGGEQP